MVFVPYRSDWSKEWKKLTPANDVVFFCGVEVLFSVMDIDVEIYLQHVVLLIFVATGGKIGEL